jgi:hypothetical protein
VSYIHIWDIGWSEEEGREKKQERRSAPISMSVLKGRERREGGRITSRPNQSACVCQREVDGGMGVEGAGLV